MSSKFTEAFDSLKSDDNTKRERTERILSSQSASDADIKRPTHKNAGSVAVAARKPFSMSKRAVAWVTAIAVFVGVVAISVPTGISLYNNRGLLGAMSLLKNTFVDMDGVAAFGVWNAPDGESKKARITNVSYVRTPANPDGNENRLVPYETPDDDTDKDTDTGDGDIITGDWSDDERYDWESDYDWDPTKANVLIAIGEDGKISEVVYERTNERGQVRQDKLGNAAAVFVSDGFTYIEYVDDETWDDWKTGYYSDSVVRGCNFGCFHEKVQTVVIHNETGKVFPLNDIIPQVNELSGATNYTLGAEPLKNDVLYIRPLYGRWIPLWFNVIYDEQSDKIRYELILPLDYAQKYNVSYNVLSVRRDKYGQQYVLEGENDDIVSVINLPRVKAGIVNIPEYEFINGVLVHGQANGMMMGDDGRMYAFDDGKLKVFGEGFTLSPVEPNTTVTVEGVANDWSCYQYNFSSGIVYRLQDGYLYSTFGQVWKVDDDGSLHEYTQLSGSFPHYADEAYMIGGEIIAFVNTQPAYDGRVSLHGKLVHIRFDNNDGAPKAIITHILDAAYVEVTHNHRMIAVQTADPFKTWVGPHRSFIVTVTDGVPNAEFVLEGWGNEQGGRLIKPVTEPIVFTP